MKALRQVTEGLEKEAINMAPNSEANWKKPPLQSKQ
jgi:hypothetical protein